MAHVVIVTDPDCDYTGGRFYLRNFERIWRERGHQVAVGVGPDALPDGDVAILHVDLSVVPEEYLEACRKYPRVVNGRTTDIRKRVVSRNLVTRGDGYEGPVIVKTDLNCGGRPEAKRVQNAIAAGLVPPPEITGLAATDKPYPLFATPGDVPDGMWTKPGLVVERFLPERDARGFWVRTWTFFGDQGRAARYLSESPIVKSSTFLAREPVAVPPEIQAERERLGFDYGKFDFVVHRGRPVLLDANRTPGTVPPEIAAQLAASDGMLASGLRSFLDRGTSER